jgi:DNA-binding transcriptional ArsR family regulator
VATAATTKRAVELTDPRALRALAHPTRLELIGLLRQHGPMTATQTGDRIGESPASCSFHLRQLAKYGLVEEAGGGRGRERPWRATAISTEWATRGPDEETEAATALLSRVVIGRYFHEAMEWLKRRPDEPPEWIEAAASSDALVCVTPEELRELEAGVGALVEPYLKRLEDPSPPREGTRTVSIIAIAFPLPEERRED